MNNHMPNSSWIRIPIVFGLLLLLSTTFVIGQIGCESDSQDGPEKEEVRTWTKMAESSENVVHGIVSGKDSYYSDSGVILTDIRIRIITDLKGNLPERQDALVLTEIGGTVGDRSLQVGAAIPPFNLGAEVLVFTEITGDGRLIPWGDKEGWLIINDAPGATSGMTTLGAQETLSQVRQWMIDHGFKPRDNPTALPEISMEEAKAILDQAVAYAKKHDLDALCGMGGAVSICERHWRDAGEWDGVPSEPPKIVDTYLIPERKTEMGTSVAGRVLVLEGTNGKGEPYRTEFFVFRDGDSGKLAALYPIYWSGIGIAEYNDDGTVTTGGTPQSE